MIRAAVDLHIHSCLSPCGNQEMTPNNIVLMAKLKGLDIIALCDHNHTGNLRAVSESAAEQGVVLLPGLELETSEEIHLLCYFSCLSDAEKMQTVINQYYQYIPNRKDIFGAQMIMDTNDQPVEEIEHLLTAATSLDLYNAVSVVRELGGAAIPAHVDRESYSIISNLGLIPDDLDFKTLELSRYTTAETFLNKYPEYKGRQFITSSDAHELGMILERESFLELEELSVVCLLDKLKEG